MLKGRSDFGGNQQSLPHFLCAPEPIGHLWTLLMAKCTHHHSTIRLPAVVLEYIHKFFDPHPFKRWRLIPLPLNVSQTQWLASNRIY